MFVLNFKINMDFGIIAEVVTKYKIISLSCLLLLKEEFVSPNFHFWGICFVVEGLVLFMNKKVLFVTVFCLTFT